MQNAGHFGQGAVSAHQSQQQFVSSEPSPNGGTTTSSLRQFRKKDVDKTSLSDGHKQVSESHVARVAPQNHYPPVSNDYFRYQQHQFSDYSPPVKYSDIVEPSQPNPISTSVIQKPKSKDYMDMCNVNVQQSHMKQPFPDHMAGHQNYSPENGQFLHKEPTQVPPSGYKPDSHFYPKDQPHQYQQMPHHPPQKYNAVMAQNMRKYPTQMHVENPFLSKLSKLHPSMARSIMSDHHLQDGQPGYHGADQRGIYANQNQRYYSGAIPQSNIYAPNPNYSMNTSHSYPSYSSASCSYPRGGPMGVSMPQRYPHMERSMSPARRGYPPDNMHVPHMNYHGMPQKMGSHNYASPQYGAPEYAQHYQHRRMPQEYYQQHIRPHYMQNHQMPVQEIAELPESRVSPSDSLKKFIENWDADEEPSTEINAIESNINVKDNVRLREEVPAGTVYMINATDCVHFENSEIPFVTSDGGSIQLSPENYQYLIKNGLVDNSGVVRIIEANKELAIDPNNTHERIVNLQIMETPKSDCMLSSQKVKLAEENVLNQSPSNTLKSEEESKRVVIHQNTVINPGNCMQSSQVSPLPTMDPINITKELVDKNCSPINLDQLEQNLDFNEKEKVQANNDISDPNISLSDDSSGKSPGSLKSMPIIDLYSDSNIVNINNQGSGSESAEKSEEDTIKSDETTDIDNNNDSVVPLTKEESPCEEKCFKEVEEDSKIDDTTIQNEETDKTEDNIAQNFTETKLCSEIEPRQKSSVNSVIVVPESLKVNQRNVSDQNVESKTENLQVCDESSEEKLIENEIVDEKNVFPEDTSDDVAEEIVLEPPKERRKRIFSVDDIIHHAGNNIKRPSRELDAVLLKSETLKEFLEKEVEFSSSEQIELRLQKGDTSLLNNKLGDKTSEIIEDNKICPSDTVEDNMDLKTIENEDNIEIPNEANTSVLSINENVEEDTQPDKETGPDEEKNTIEPKSNVAPDETNIIPNNQLNLSKIITQKLYQDLDRVATPSPKLIEIETRSSTPTEIQYRSAIKIDETSALLQIAGELMEINVNIVNGKKVITVVPLCDTTVVDYNDNYETGGHGDEHEAEKMEISEENEDIVADEACIVKNIDATCLSVNEEMKEIDQNGEKCVNNDISNEKQEDDQNMDVVDQIHTVEEPLDEHEDIPKNDFANKENSIETTELSESDQIVTKNEILDVGEEEKENKEVTEPKILEFNEDNKEEINVNYEPVEGKIDQEEPLTTYIDTNTLDKETFENKLISENVKEICGKSMCDNNQDTIIEGISHSPVNQEEIISAEEPSFAEHTSPEPYQSNLIRNEFSDSTKESEDTISNVEVASDGISKEVRIIESENVLELDEHPMIDNDMSKDRVLSEALEFPIEEEEVFIAADVPSQEIIVSDPLDDVGYVEEVDKMFECLDIPLIEPVTTSEEKEEIKSEENNTEVIERNETSLTEVDLGGKVSIIEEIQTYIKNTNDTEKSTSQNAALEPIPVRSLLKPEVIILSPTSTNIEDHNEKCEEKVYLEPKRKNTSDNEAFILTTKAAKKAYECDLQIPAVTTSGDVTQASSNNAHKNQCDTVSSSKREKEDLSKNRKSQVKKSKRTKESNQVKSVKKELFKQISEKRKHKSESKKQQDVSKKNEQVVENNIAIPNDKSKKDIETDEDYADFKELLKARKLKKLKKMQELRDKESKRREIVENQTNKSIKTEDIIEPKPTTKEIESKSGDSHSGGEKQGECCVGCKEAVKRPRATDDKSKASKKVKKYSDKELVMKPKSIECEKVIVPANSDIKAKEPSLETPKAPEVPQEPISPQEHKKIVSFCEEKPTSTTSKTLASSSKVKTYPSKSSSIGSNPKDPRRRSSGFSAHVMVPSVLELTEEIGVNNSKRKITLADYVSRKRKVSSEEQSEKKKDVEDNSSDEIVVNKKTINDVKTSFVIHSSDWEDTQSPKPLTHNQSSNDAQELQTFSGLIKNPKPVIDLNELTPLENRDLKLQEYKDRVDSELSSLNLRIPKVKPQNLEPKGGKIHLGPFENPETKSLVKRFLNNEKMSSQEMEKIKKIISYKRWIQEKNGTSPSKSPGSSSSSPGNLSYEVSHFMKQELETKRSKIHLNKVTSKRKSFHNTAEDLPQPLERNEKPNLDYSVYNRLGKDGLKVIFKRNRTQPDDSQPPKPIVLLERLELDRVEERYKVVVNRPL